MSRIFIPILVVLSVAVGHAQAPDTFYVSAKNPNPVLSNVVLVAGTHYVIQVTGAVSYWRDVVPPGELDADAGFVYRLPYMPGVPNDTIDSVNHTIGTFQYLPCDGNPCDPTPAEFVCGKSYPNAHTTNIYSYKRFFLDRDYLSVNNVEFCPRNGADETKNNYLMGYVGNGQQAAFQFHDGDGDYAHNFGTLKVIITRLEPIMHVRDSFNFGKLRPNSANVPVIYDSVRNFGSPFFPGCQGATADLQYTVDNFTGDVGPDGFQVLGMTKGVTKTVQAGPDYFDEFKASFTPKSVRQYQGVVWLSTTDPQLPKLKIYLTGEGIQGKISVNPTDTLDFGDVPLNKPKSLPLTLKNVGTDILTVSSLFPDSVDPAFTIPVVAKTTMGVGVSTQKIFTFSPSKLKVYYSRVLVSSDGYNDAQHRVVLRGRGVAALLEVDSVLDFGNLPVGDDSIKSLPLQNVGNIPFGVQFVQFSAGDSLDFSAEPRTHITIEPDSILNWKMGFHPQKPGRRSAVAEIAADGGGAPHYVYVIGNGIVFSKMTATPRLDYGVVSIETTSTMSAVVHNVGNVPITLQQVSLANGQVWSLPATTFPTLMPKDSLRIDAVFAPLLQQAYSDTIKLIDDSLRSYAVVLTGNGKRFVGEMSVADTLDFGDIFVGDTVEKFLPVRNVGNARLALPNMFFPAAIADFSAQPNLPMRLDTAAQDSLPAFFHPTTQGKKSTTYEIVDSLNGKADGIQHLHDVTFLGNGIPPIVAILAVDTTYGGDVGTQITIPVELRSDITKTGSRYFKMNLKYDGTVLLPLSIDTAALTPGYSVTMNESVPGLLTIVGRGDATIPALTGMGNICKVTFEVLTSVAKSTPLVVLPDTVGNGRNPRSVQAVDGAFRVTGQCGSDVVQSAIATQISANVPNPFSSATDVHYVVGLPTHVTLSVYDAVGRKVADLVNEDKPAGTYTAPFVTGSLPNGLYYCRMNAGQYVKTRSMMLMR